MPYFSVVLATYNRGVHILPTVRSVLAQTFGDFELLVVGDRCTDETGSVLEPFLGERVKWINLAERGGSQSYPNNAGIELARGDFIAYIGETDLWAPDHLARLVEIFRQRIDFGVSGCLRHPPPGVSDVLVLGIFDDEQSKFEHVFPSSSFAHARRVTLSIGGWRDAREIKAPVDADFLLRAVEAGMTFASTQVVTVHEFPASARYLSSAKPQSHEQAELLGQMQRPGFADEVAAIVEASKRDGAFMALRHPAYEEQPAGEIARRQAYDSGAIRAALQPLSRSASIRQTNEPRGLDWAPFGPGESRFRWSYLNPRPKILIPYSSPAPVNLRIEVTHEDLQVLKGLGIEVNGKAADFRLDLLRHNGMLWEATAAMTVSLSETDHSIVVIVIPPRSDQPGGAEHGIGVAEMMLDPPSATMDESGRTLAVALAREKVMLHGLKVLQSGEATELRQRIGELKASFSWRLTAPLRELRRGAGKVYKEMKRFRRKLGKEMQRAERKYIRRH